MLPEGLDEIRSMRLSSRWMLTRITKAIRFWAASFLVAGYAVCALAPAAALAWGDAARAAHCLTNEHTASKADQSAADHIHDHEGAPHQHPASDDGDKSASDCCGIACVNALPASVPGFVNTVMSAGVRIAMVQESVIGGAPPLLYRPPIILSSI